MGDLQTYFYLALISVIMISLTLLFVFIVFRSLRRWAKQAHGRTPLIFWLVGGAITVTLLFIVFGTAGVLYGFIRYGTQ
jgi:4-amino-4-deoxy-L-arabinose transferase-like glycosyltransferase